MALRGELFRCAAAAAFVLLHVVGGGHPWAPSSASAITVGIIQTFSLLQVLLLPLPRARAAKKATDLEPSLGEIASATVRAATASMQAAARGRLGPCAAMALAVFALARLQRRYPLVESPVEASLAALALGAVARGLVSAAAWRGHAARPALAVERHPCRCAPGDCDGGVECPYKLDFWEGASRSTHQYDRAEEEDAAALAELSRACLTSVMLHEPRRRRSSSACSSNGPEPRW